MPANKLIVSPQDQKSLLGTYTKDSYNLQTHNLQVGENGDESFIVRHACLTCESDDDTGL